MALRGNLKDFSLPDVFQLVTFSRKTGVLRITREDGVEGTVWFRDGDVFFASSNWHADPLGQRLVRAQRITPQALKRALELRSAEAQDGRRLGQILIDEGYITDKVLEEFVSEQIQDTIFDLMRWDEGEFDFEAMPEVAEEDIGLSVSIENVVMEGARRLEEWNRIKKKIPSMDVVFKMATAPGEGTFEISLKPTEWQLLLLIDGTRSVAELAVETHRTDFDVARIIYGLFSAGLLEFATEEEIEHNRAERAEREAKLAEIEAARKAAEEAAKAAALEREAKLAAEAEARVRAEAAAMAAAETPAEASPAPERVPESTEVPEFLGGSTIAPTADDQSVLEEFMGAVLQKPGTAPAPAPQAAKPEPAPVPHVPADEPAFMSAPLEDEGEATVGAASIAGLLGIEAAPVAPTYEPAVTAEPAPAVEPEAALAPEPEMGPAPEPAPVVEYAPEPVSEPEFFTPESAVEAQVPAAADAEPAFEQDLMALGLGELPADLLAPVTVEPEPQPELIELEPVAEPMSQQDSIADDLSALVGDLGLPTEVPPAVAEPAEAATVEPDFSALLESLDVDAVEAEPVEELAPEERGFDVELLVEDEAPAPAGGVISTDAFLDDITIEDMGFSGGLNDELSALTGADRRGPVRPQASVNAIPDNDGAVLKRDARVDKDTVLKIIDGIKNL